MLMCLFILALLSYDFRIVLMAGPLFLGTLISGPVVPHIPESPCPDVFQYRTQTMRDHSVSITGLITITDPPVELVLNLFIHLQLLAVLPSKYVGMVELIDRTNITKGNSSATQMYRVRFPLFKPVPTVRLISVNSHVICSGPPGISTVSGPVVTDIRLEHTLWPRHLTNESEPATTAQPSTRAPHGIGLDGECGQAVLANPLVVGGRQLRQGEWPWLVAVFVVNSLGLEFHCSGTIISKAFIVTVGHCMNHAEAGTMTPEDVFVYLGKFNLQQWEEPHSVIKEVISIHLHPEFDSAKFTADIALLRLKTPTEFNMFIQPACLWSRPPDLHLIVGQIGTVVGWGRNTHDGDLSPIPRIKEVPIVSTEECVQSHSEFVHLTSSHTLCAGAKDGSGPCNGDSGGGLMMPVKLGNTSRWELRGIVSLSLLNTTTMSCDLNQYVVFTDTAKFLPWIISVVNNNS